MGKDASKFRLCLLQYLNSSYIPQFGLGTGLNLSN